MNVEEVLDHVLAALERNHIAYMVAGSFASNVHGVPRATFDADVVIETSLVDLETFVAESNEQFYVSLDAAREALMREGMFNLIHFETGFKIDLIARKSRPFSREEFSRRLEASCFGRSRWFASPEDVILSKLEWAKMGNSERQLRDALNIAKVQGERLDRAYLEKWAKSIGVEDLLSKIL